MYTNNILNKKGGKEFPLKIKNIKKQEKRELIASARFSCFSSKMMIKAKRNIVSMLHTFGGDMKWNPHVHHIVTEGSYNTKE